MKMEYKLLDNGTGIILTRQPEFVEDELLYIQFSSAEADATAIFERKGGDSLYRLLSDGLCSVPVAKLKGIVSVTVANLGKTPIKRWLCEEIKVEIGNGGYLISPNDMNLPQKVVKIELQMQDLNRNFASLEEKYKLLENKFEKILEGYDLT